MKLVRYGQKGSEKPGLLDADGNLRDLSHEFSDFGADSMTAQALQAIKDLDIKDLPVVDGKPRLGVPLTGIGKLVCIGLNYSDHAKELGADIPSEPVVFMKATSSLTGPFDDIRLPRDSTRTDWEVELAIVIGDAASYVSEEDAINHVAGFSTFIDLSERDFQNKRGGQWTKGKSCDTFGPLGPWIVTRDEIMDPQRLSLWLEVDGRRKQYGNTELMIFGVSQIVSYVSQFMTLHPGDVIATGTPPGVGAGMDPPEYLRAGNRIDAGVDGLGNQSHFVVGA
ncbi:MAG TPA: 2-hydroxyhepta-2,4-diene-1,7-dioate isomerase [Rhodospirillaceae bacterium]|nr:2-hydroxyhepta-2,4-diene-1,7-dioate isomerase [Rhodospirillaceae bacterium]MAX62123.1 2-hydroxyhepta-2,4-diene-1,7-dioate isomerase [Rhodospirillaceae bacterium]MBB58094.1 2-hydroxyhepta-2,4-diene-1,7-dioate isomerase [Rhodospirillaceae bacterium]HAJ22701.1 2-hydroxyhepta-2,4-diene-1,7-dioate isomerase [Rhodospirillaceae bacterium]|tara:strand:+ start:91089 stop:91931 length:843 start_codon:yes stop_codon:yes gene_type:complete